MAVAGGLINGTTQLTVSPATLVSFQITPVNPSTPLGMGEQFVAAHVGRPAQSGKQCAMKALLVRGQDSVKFMTNLSRHIFAATARFAMAGVWSSSCSDESGMSAR